MSEIIGEIVIPFYFRYPFLSKELGRVLAKGKLKKIYPTGKIRWLRVM